MIDEGDGTRTATTALVGSITTTYIYRIEVTSSLISIYQGTTEENLSFIGSVAYAGGASDTWTPYFKLDNSAESGQGQLHAYLDYVKIYADRGEPGNPTGSG